MFVTERETEGNEEGRNESGRDDMTDKEGGRKESE